MEVELDLPNYTTISDLKNATRIDTSKFAEKVDLANLKNKSDTDKLKNVPTNLSNLKTNVDKLDVDKLAPGSVDLSKLSTVVKIDVDKKGVYNDKIKNTENKKPYIINSATNAFLNA